MSEFLQSGHVLTWSGDGFIRLWNLADLSLRREFQVAAKEAFVSDAEFLPDGNHAIVATTPKNWQTERAESSTDIAIVNLESGEQRKLLTINQTPVVVEVVENDMLYSTGNRIVRATTDNAAQVSEFVVDQPVISFVTSANKRYLLAVDYTYSD